MPSRVRKNKPKKKAEEPNVKEASLMSTEGSERTVKSA